MTLSRRWAGQRDSVARSISYLPEGRKYYTPTENGLEKRIKERLDHWRQQLEG